MPNSMFYFTGGKMKQDTSGAVKLRGKCTPDSNVIKYFVLNILKIIFIYVIIYLS